MTRLTTLLLLFACPLTASAAERTEDASATPEGHSFHGDFYNEGPRQQAYLMGGTGYVSFEVTTDQDQVQAFVEQGIGQIYGFWYLEAERSFRHAASLDPDCAIAYWGAALATAGKPERAKGFIAEAVKRKDKCSDREQMYIDSLDEYLKADPKKSDERDDKYRKALEDIILKYPDDLDAKGLLALQLYKNRKNGHYLAADAFMDEIFAEQPLHSAHHFRIHLWDHRKPEKALESAARCGQGSPAIAHMWHMPGHIYSRLKRYEDACWQQEASARVDHYHMIHDRVLPDEIHNYAHNNEWLIRNLNFVGRVRDAVDLAKNMIELPRHPKYNTLKRGSSQYGRRRLMETLEQYELWEEAVALCGTSYLEPTDDTDQQVKRLRLLGISQASLGQTDDAGATLSEIKASRDAETAKRDEARNKAEQEKIDELLKKEGKKYEDADEDARQQLREEVVKREKKEIDKARNDAGRSFDRTIREMDKAVEAIEGYLAVGRGDFAAALPLLKKAGGIDPLTIAKVQYQAGEHEQALKAARDHVAKKDGEVHPHAELVDLLWLAGEREEAAKALDELRKTSSSIDMQSPVFERITPIAEELGIGSDWVLPAEPRDDVGDRPDLDALGPFRWQPSAAPAWTLQNAAGESVSLKEFSGKPVVVIFYLGYGCLHCAEQLHKFAPEVKAFHEAGLGSVAIRSDDTEGLKRSIDAYDKEPLPIPLVSNAKLDVFKEYRVYDDFENQPLHGTFLIDGQGDVLWQDISYEPFMEPEFVLEEAKRLLGME